MTTRLMPVLALVGAVLLGLTGERPAEWTPLPATDADVRSQQNVVDPHDGIRAIFEDQPSYIPFEEAADPQRLTTITVTYNGFTPAAQAAFQRAVDIWATILTSPVPIRVQATMSSLEPGVLGSAGANLIYANFPGAPVQNTWFIDGIADRSAGSDLNPGAPDIVANFTTSPSVNWYFGTDGRPASGQFDFVTVVLHELCHGLGFVGSGVVNSAGQGVWGTTPGGSSTPLPYIFDRYVKNGAGQAITSFPTPSTALAQQLTGNSLFFASPLVPDRISAPARLFAPATFQSGSTYSHLDETTYAAGNPNSLMTPQLAQMEAIHSPGPITSEIFTDSGWGQTQTPPPGGIPSPPTNLIASVVGNVVTVSFTGSAGATSYRLVATGPGLNFDANIGTLTTVSGTVPPGTYSVSVFAVNAAGQSAPATTTFTVGGGAPPPPVTGLTATVSGRNVTLTWNAAPGATSYHLTASISGVGVVFNQNIGNLTTVSAANVPPGTYSIQVFSVGPGGQNPSPGTTQFIVQ